MVTAPAVTPVTMPVVLTVALAVLLLLHTPPVLASVRVMLAPGQTDVAPTIGLTTLPALTVNAIVAVAVPQLVVTV
jgi:hypothetical protein